MYKFSRWKRKLLSRFVAFTMFASLITVPIQLASVQQSTNIVISAV